VNLKKDLEKGQVSDEELKATPTSADRLKPLPIVVRKVQPRVLDHLEDEILIVGTSTENGNGKSPEKPTTRAQKKAGRPGRDTEESTAEVHGDRETSCEEPTIPPETVPQMTRQLRVVLHRLTDEQLIEHGIISPKSVVSHVCSLEIYSGINHFRFRNKRSSKKLKRNLRVRSV
jgi:hypothetical protein